MFNDCLNCSLLLGIVGESVSLFEDKLDEKFLIVATEMCDVGEEDEEELISVDEPVDTGYFEW